MNNWLGWPLLGVGVVGSAWLSAYQPMAAGVLLLAVALAVLNRYRSGILTVVLVGLAIVAASNFGTTLVGATDAPVYNFHRAGVAAVAGLVILLNFRDVWARLGTSRWFVAWLLWCGLSALWGGDLAAGVFSLAAMLGAVGIGLVLAGVYPVIGSKIVVFALLAALAASAIGYFVAPSLTTVTTYRPELRAIVERFVGFWPWNSDLGMVAGIVLILTFATWKSRGRWVGMVIMGGAGAVLVVSDSATSIVATAVAGLVMVWFRSPRHRLVLVAGVVVSGFLAWAADLGALRVYLLSALGRSEDLTGRASIWDVVLELSAEHPVVGYGIGNAPNLIDYLGFNAHAHNGYLQVLLEVGWVGLVLFALAIVTAMIRLVRAGSWQHLGILAFLLVSNMANNYVIGAHLSTALLAWILFLPVGETVARKNKRTIAISTLQSVHRNHLRES